MVTSCPASARSMAATIPASPAPTIPMESFSSFFLPGPFWALAMRFSLRKESFPICFLAPSDAKGSAAAVDDRMVGDDVDDDVNAILACECIGDTEKEWMDDGSF